MMMVLMLSLIIGGLVVGFLFLSFFPTLLPLHYWCVLCVTRSSRFGSWLLCNLGYVSDLRVYVGAYVTWDSMQLLATTVTAPRTTKRSRPVTGERTLDHVLVLGCTRASWSYHGACVMLPHGSGARGGRIFQDMQIADRRGARDPM